MPNFGQDEGKQIIVNCPTVPKAWFCQYLGLGIFHYSFSVHLNRYFLTEHLKGCVHPDPGDSPEALLVSVPEPLEDLVAGEQETAAVR